MEKKKLRWDDRLWMWGNKKPNSGLMTYAVMVIPWCFMGFLLGLVGFAVASEVVVAKILGYALLLILICQAVVTYRSDRAKGYVDTMQKHYVERYEKRKAEILARQGDK